MQKTKVSNIIYPESFQTQYLYCYGTFNKELKEMIEESGYKSEFIKKFRKSLKFLEGLKENCIKQRKLFEKLKNNKDIFSIMLKGEKNIRILFTFANYNNSKKAILLYVFEEKDINNNSKTSYSSAIGIANKRIKELLKYRGGV